MSETIKGRQRSELVMSRDGGDYGLEGEAEAGLIDFWQILRVLQRWWWLIALIVTLITAATAVILFRATPMYKASALLEVKQEERNVVNVSEVESIVVDQEFLTTQIELLQSESLIESTVESLNLLRDPYLAPLDNPEWQALPRDEKVRSVVFNFGGNLNVTPVGRSLLIRVSFEHDNPAQAAKITNELTKNYIDNGLARKLNATAFASSFLEERLETVRASLEGAERELVSYASENDIIIVNGEDAQDATGSLDMTALKTLNTELTTASVARAEAETAYNQSLQSSFTNELLDNDALSRLKAARIDLNSEYLEKLSIYKPSFPEMLELKSRINLYDEEIEDKTREIISSARNKYKDDYERAQSKESDLRGRVSALKTSVVDVREKSIDYNILKRQVETERTQYEALLQRLKEVSVADDLGSDLVQVVDKAQTPRFPFKPNRLRGILLALILSSALGFGIAYAIELIDDHIKGPDDVKTKLNQIIMGVIPISKDPDELLTELVDPQTSVSEAYSSLRTNLQFSGPDGGPRVIQITSTRSGEGKSVSSLGTALRFAGLGQKVLLVDADMRLPTFMQTGNASIGLSGVLTSRTDFASQIQKTRYEGLDLLPSGVTVPNPSEILASERFDEFLEFARNNYAYVIIDSPPVLGLADAPILGAKVDATLLVIEAKRLRTPNIKASLERLRNSGTKVLGIVLSKYKAQSKGYMDYYQYTYGDGANSYSESVKDASKKRKSKRKFELV